jgi:hypothetical protein
MFNISCLSALGAGYGANSRRNPGENKAAPEDKSRTSLSYGIDPDKVPLALSADGTKARYLALCPSHIKLQISKTADIGEVEFRRFSLKETVVTYAPARGDVLSVHSTFPTPAASARGAVLTLALDFQGHKAVLDVTQDRGLVLPAGMEASLQAIRSGASANASLVRLLSETPTFTSEPALSGLIPFLRQFDGSSPIGCQLECVRAINNCIVAFTTYAGGITVLILFCGETLGLTCVLAIVSHPFLSIAVATECNNAISTCKICSNSGNGPGHNGDFIVGEWDDYWYSWMSTGDNSYQLRYRFQWGVDGNY